MKNMRNIFAVLLIAVVAAAFTACGSGAGSEETSETAAPADQTQAAEQTEIQAEAEEDGQNPIMNYIGPYTSDRAMMFIEASGDDGAKVTVTWGSGATENSEWSMTGSFDSESRVIEYRDCVKTDYVFNEDGDLESKEEVYVGGHGRIVFSEGDSLTLTWEDDQENAADGMVFTFDPEAQL